MIICHFHKFRVCITRSGKIQMSQPSRQNLSSSVLLCLGVSTIIGRKSVLMLAQRMTCSFCRAIGASNYDTWKKIPMKCGNDMRISSRKNLNDPGEPIGVILCAFSSVWLPIVPLVLFGFFRDDSQRKVVYLIFLLNLFPWFKLNFL